MIQIRLHGRGGQGVVTAAELLAMAAWESGQYAQAFPSFGVERTGAPIESFVRIDQTYIFNREHVKNPDILLIQDPSLLSITSIFNDIQERTIIIINTSLTKEAVCETLKNQNIQPRQVHTIDATSLALKHLGKNIVNTIMAAALAKMTGLIYIDNLKKLIQVKFLTKGASVIEKNLAAIDEAYQNIL